MPPTSPSRRTSSKQQELKKTQTGLLLVDEISVARTPTIDDYVCAVSQYVLETASLTPARSKQAQIALGSALGRALAADLTARVPRISPHPGELTVAGALRSARADVSEAHSLDGLRLAVEIKPVNLAVGRALWNRFGDIRAFAVNIHLKFPFAVVGGVLVVPMWSWEKLTKAMTAEITKDVDLWSSGGETADDDHEEDVDEEGEAEELARAGNDVYKKSTLPLIERLIRRLMRTRARESEADPAHLLEATTVVVYDPDTAQLHPTLPPVGSGLRWDEFVSAMADTYDIRFE